MPYSKYETFHHLILTRTSQSVCIVAGNLTPLHSTVYYLPTLLIHFPPKLLSPRPQHRKPSLGHWHNQGSCLRSAELLAPRDPALGNERGFEVSPCVREWCTYITVELHSILNPPPSHKLTLSLIPQVPQTLIQCLQLTDTLLNVS
jgi:hypothetical protein